MNYYLRATVHELEAIYRLVDTHLKGDNLDFIIDWTREGTDENLKYNADIIIFFLGNLEGR